MIDNAILCAKQGWAVFALWAIQNGKCSCGNPQCGSPGKHPIESGGFKNATIDIDTIKTFSSVFGNNINIGLATGQVSNIVVLDIDRKSGGIQSLQKLIQKNGTFNKTIRVCTGGGGYHLYFTYPKNAIIKNSTSKVADGLDIRGDGGYVIIPESKHVSGNVYTWDISPNGNLLTEMPDWLIEAATKQKSKKTVIRSTISLPKNIQKNQIPSGQRNCIMTSEAGKLRRIGRTKDEILASLIITNHRCSPPLTDTELEAIVSSVCSYPLNDLIHYELTDIGDLQRFADHFNEVLSIVKTIHTKEDKDGEWYHFNDHIWQKLTDNMVINLYYVPLFQDIDEQINSIIDEDIRKHYKKYVKQMKSLRYMNLIINTAKGHTLFKKPEIQFDQQPYLFACKNGVIDLTTGELRNGKPEDYLTIGSDIIYDVNAKCDRWLTFLEEIFDGNEELIHYIQKAVGYTLTGANKEECFFLLIGKGRNGKSKFIEAIRKVMGAYHSNLRFSSLEIQKTEKIRNDLAKLSISRMVSVSEGRDDRDIDESLLKDMTGGDQITSRLLFKEDFSYVPQFALWLFSNKKPRVNEGSAAFYERARIISFNRQFLGDTADKNLAKKLTTELSGILNWAVQGCLIWQREGLTPPSCIVQATEEFKKANESPYEIFANTLKKGGLTKPNALYKAYKNWCFGRGEEALSMTKFGTKIKDFVEYSKTKRQYCISLTQQHKSEKYDTMLEKIKKR